MFTNLRAFRPSKLAAPASASPGLFELPAGGSAGLLTPHISLELGRYQIRLAMSEAEREAACRLRFKVFNLELGEGLMSSYSTGLDKDRFDLVCDHLIVEDSSSGKVVGTYRMQSGLDARRHWGYYSAQEFDFAPYEAIRDQVLELGRASIEARPSFERSADSALAGNCAVLQMAWLAVSDRLFLAQLSGPGGGVGHL